MVINGVKVEKSEWRRGIAAVVGCWEILVLKFNFGFDVCSHSPCVHPGMAEGRKGLDSIPAGKWRLQGSATGNNHGLVNSCRALGGKGTAEFPALGHRSDKG